MTAAPPRRAPRPRSGACAAQGTKDLAGAADHQRRLAAARPGARGDRPRVRPADHRRPRRAARQLPGAEAAPGLGRLGRLLERRPAARRASAPSPTRTPTACGRSATRSRAPARATCCSRTPTSSASSTTRTPRSPAARTSSPSPATTSARSPTTRSPPSSARSARCRAPRRCGRSAPTTTPASRSTVETNVADETDVDNPTGFSPLGAVGPLAIAQAAGGTMQSAPGRLTGRMCLRITFAERPNRPARFCNRYVSSGDLRPVPRPARQPDRLQRGDGRLGRVQPDRALHGAARRTSSNVHAEVETRRGERVAFLRRVQAPRRVGPARR